MDDFEPEVHACQLPQDVVQARLTNTGVEAAAREVLQPRIDGHLLACQTAIDTLVDAHRDIIERTDLDLDSQTRPLAVWELAGRCLALANALVDQLRLGYGPETVGTMRILHEAANLLMVVIDEEDGRLTRRWLAGGRIEQREARQALGQIHRRVASLAAEHGLQIEGDLEALTRGVYGVLSRGTHNERRGFGDSLSRPGRSFAYGPHPSVLVRAVYVDYASALIEQIIVEVGHGLTGFYGRDWYDQTVTPLVAALHALREDMPIDEGVRARLGYGGDEAS